MGLKIVDAVSYVPDRTVDNSYFESYLDTTNEWIVQRTGIEKRHFSDLQVSEMVLNASKKLQIFNRESIKLVISATVTSDYVVPSLSALVHKELDLLEEVLSFDINMACTGFIGGLIVAESMLKVGEQAVIIGAEKLSNIINFDDRATAMLFGDGAAVTIVEKTNEKFSKVSGTVPSFDLKFINDGKSKVTMEGRNVYKFATSVIPSGIDKLLGMNNINVCDIEHFVLHQANLRIIESIVKKTGYKEKFFTNIQNMGNTSSASIGLCLAEMKNKNILKNGDRALLFGFGGGLTYAGVIVECGI
ncbi:ketoacyl-ACP synthase III [Peptoniphilus mikwangii]|uniref:ketoacyl-ACP synthase III n=1 Tax=Peptoniphilus mikwangii TaxID=1354300 RepID=UPI000405CE2C|nr:ketoacyl-ACP synthase III [Peptoniphilus mikwangii]